jgi:NDP-sugar pyrophosphorylase family protein
MQKPLPIVLAGGKGVRFAPFVTDKILWPFLGKPFIYYVLSSLSKAGFQKVVVITNEANNLDVKKLSVDNLDIQTVIQNGQNGMSDAIISAENFVADEGVLIINGDDILHHEVVNQVLEKISSTNPEYLTVGLKSKKYLPVGYLKISGNKAFGVVEKPTQSEKPSDYIKLMFDYFANGKNLINLLRSQKAVGDDNYELVLDELFKSSGAELVSYDRFWSKLKHPHFVLDIMDVFQTNQLIHKNVDKTAYVAQNVVIEGDVFVDSGARIESGTIIKGPTYIGRNTVIGNNSLIRASLIEFDCVIGFGSEIARSYLGPRCRTHHAFVGDSVLESDINMSWGVVTANLRFDNKTVLLNHPSSLKIDTERQKLGAMIAKGAFLGVNTCTMPGACIGEKTIVKPSTIVS